MTKEEDIKILKIQEAIKILKKWDKKPKVELMKRCGIIWEVMR